MSILQGIRATIHSLTKPKRSSKKANRGKASSAKRVNRNISNAKELQENLEQKITKKISNDMQKMKQQMQQELLEKLTSQNTAHTNHGSEKEKKIEAAIEKRAGSKGNKASTNLNKGIYNPQSDCTFLKLLILSDHVKGEVVVGYEVLDNSSQKIWGIGIHEGTRLGRSTKILNTKVKSRKVESVNANLNCDHPAGVRSSKK
ncbi:hypothetical protein [Paenibacillus thalictri]|nr:hypothetical protein [Paenibacillus thalictri]